MNILEQHLVMTDVYTNPPISQSNETFLTWSNSQYAFVIRCLSLYALLLIIVGTLGNFLTIIVLLRKNLRRFVTIRYLIVVSICDTISLYGWNLNDFYKFTISPQNNIEEISIVHCRVISFMTFVSLQLSSWCLTAVSLDRALNLLLLHWKHSYGRAKYTKYYITVLTLICIALNSHILFLNGYHTPSGNVKCYAAENNPDYIYPQWERVHLVLYNLCPFAIMCTCNTYIIVVTIRSSRSQIETAQPNVQKKTVDRYRQLTALLIIVTFAFVLLTLPACIYFVFFRHILQAKAERNYRYMIQISLNSVQFTSHAINFFLYCFSAKSFLNELSDMFNECVAYFRVDDEEWSVAGVRTNNDQGNDEPASEYRRAHPDQEMYVKKYEFRTAPEMQLTSEQPSH